MSYIGGSSSNNYIGTKPAAAGVPAGGGDDKVFFENDQTITTSYTLVAAKNAMTAGPITIDSGATVTIETGARWVVI